MTLGRAGPEAHRSSTPSLQTFIHCRRHPAKEEETESTIR